MNVIGYLRNAWISSASLGKIRQSTTKRVHSLWSSLSLPTSVSLKGVTQSISQYKIYLGGAFAAVGIAGFVYYKSLNKEESGEESNLAVPHPLEESVDFFTIISSEPPKELAGIAAAKIPDPLKEIFSKAKEYYDQSFKVPTNFKEETKNRLFGNIQANREELESCVDEEKYIKLLLTYLAYLRPLCPEEAKQGISDLEIGISSYGRKDEEAD